MDRIFLIFLLYMFGGTFALFGQSVGLTLIPPTIITNQVNLDIRAGLVNNENTVQKIDISIYLNEKDELSLLHHSQVTLAPGQSHLVNKIISTKDKVGNNKIILVTTTDKETFETSKNIEVLDSPIRSTQTIDGTWSSLYIYSETEGKYWNPDLRKMTDSNWRELVHSMNKLDMNIVVIQESFRNEEYVGKHNIEQEGYQGKAFYSSELYPGRMPITAKDPIENILTQADQDSMYVFLGVGMYAWFDYTEGSLKWHKKVAKELWEKYHHHPSFYGFYVSEEGVGSLDSWETDPAKKLLRQQEVVHFFAEFKQYCSEFAPDKPIMFAPNAWGITEACDKYPILLKNVDIICPFAFARMPKNDLAGAEAVKLFQKWCDEAGSHLWLDLEVFNFDENYSLCPKTIENIKQDMLAYSNFEKILCFQLPGIFNDPSMSFRIGQESTLTRFMEYLQYLKQVKKQRNM
ncbi:DUF4434 domain-containing protein [Bacteroides uniformis]|uniref:DUF4434 domain-containing protein n=1 Tax=Bacteroides uniformis TaxID=820 RepID=UPI003516EA4A